MAQEKEKEKGLNITLDERTKKKVYPKIKEKLASLLEGDGGDNNLLEYIMLLISNNRAKSHIATDLEAFFGKEAKPFTNWLWDLLVPFASPSPIAVPAPTEPKESEGKRKIDRDRLKRQSVKRKSEKEEPTETKPVSRSPEDRTKEPEKSTDESVSKESDKPKAEGVPRIFATAVKKSAESTTKQKRRVKKVRTGDRKVQVKKRKVVKLSTNAIKEDQRAELRRARFTVTLNQPDLNSHQESIQLSTIEDPPLRALPSSKTSKRARIVRIAQSQPSSSSSASAPSPSSPLLSSQSAISLPVKTAQTLSTSTSVSDTTGTTTPVKNSSENTPATSTNTTSTNTTSTTSTTTIRCSFWPACSKGDDCPFHHPKETCKFFPNCTFGDSCLNIHPQIPCKFGINCANPSCSFTHPPAVSGRGRGRGRGTRGRGRGIRGRGRGTSNGRGRGRGRGGGRGVSSGPPCRFGAKCTRPGCTFTHPSKNLTLISASDAACHFDPHCTTINCPFTHPKRGAQERDFLQEPTLSKEVNGVKSVPVAG